MQIFLVFLNTKRFFFLAFYALFCLGKSARGEKSRSAVVSLHLLPTVTSSVTASYEENEKLTWVDLRVNMFPHCFRREGSLRCCHSSICLLHQSLRSPRAEAAGPRVPKWWY